MLLHNIKLNVQGWSMLRSIFFAMALLSLVVTTGCSSQSNGVNVSLGQQFNLSLGETASINGEQLKIKFVEVVSDSRCPKNAVCIWAGEVNCTVEITYLQSVNRKTLVKSGASPEYANADFGEFEIKFDVQPYPEAGKKIENYQLKLIINRKPA